MSKPLILVTNDDGINAPGIRNLISVMKEIGDVIVVAPDSPQSGMGHAITINSTLHTSKITPKNSKTIEYSCSGTPADCVKLAINELMPRKPDLCVSGINHGSNSSINVIYSGTMSAAIEAGIEGVPAIGFSLLDYKWNANFEESKNFIKKITLTALKNGIPNGVVLNVNIPSVKKSKIKGVKVCRQAKAFWDEEFDKRIRLDKLAFFVEPIIILMVPNDAGRQLPQLELGTIDKLCGELLSCPSFPRHHRQPIRHTGPHNEVRIPV